jgi:hypothetical protein
MNIGFQCGRNLLYNLQGSEFDNLRGCHELRVRKAYPKDYTHAIVALGCVCHLGLRPVTIIHRYLCIAAEFIPCGNYYFHVNPYLAAESVMSEGMRFLNSPWLVQGLYGMNLYRIFAVTRCNSDTNIVHIMLTRARRQKSESVRSITLLY